MPERESGFNRDASEEQPPTKDGGMEMAEASAEHGEAEREFWDTIPEVDAVVVLGEWLEKNEKGEVTPSLESKMRAIAALELFRHGKAKKSY